MKGDFKTGVAPDGNEVWWWDVTGYGAEEIPSSGPVTICAASLKLLAGVAAHEFVRKNRTSGVTLSSITEIQLRSLTEGWMEAVGKKTARWKCWPAGASFSIRWQDRRGRKHVGSVWVAQTMTDVSAFGF